LKVLDTSSHSGVTFIPDAGGDGDTWRLGAASVSVAASSLTLLPSGTRDRGALLGRGGARHQKRGTSAAGRNWTCAHCRLWGLLAVSTRALRDDWSALHCPHPSYSAATARTALDQGQFLFISPVMHLNMFGLCLTIWYYSLYKSEVKWSQLTQPQQGSNSSL
jgi:hypothetical protein